MTLEWRYRPESIGTRKTLDERIGVRYDELGCQSVVVQVLFRWL
ncbi:hypothetical protein BH23BAC3_BH23BAC3_30290 [soil metagenome]